MTWIRTVPLTEADEKLRRAVEAQKALYPKEYATPVHPTPDGTSGIVASHSLIPDALYHAFATFGATNMTVLGPLRGTATSYSPRTVCARNPITCPTWVPINNGVSWPTSPAIACVSGGS